MLKKGNLEMFIKNHAVSVLLASTFLSAPVLADTLDDLKNLPGMSSSIKWGEYEAGGADSASSGSINFGSEDEPDIVLYKYEKPEGYEVAPRITSDHLYENIENRVFQNNSHNASGAVMQNSGDSSNIVFKADFVNNNATSNSGYGGVIHNVNAGRLKEISGTFVKNEAEYGGAISNRANKAGTTPKIETITGNFVENKARADGGAIFNALNKGDTAIISNVSANFIANTAVSGGGIYNSSKAEISNITGSSFIGNNATEGGAIYNDGTIGTISKSDFKKNSGNAIENYGTIGEIVNSSFEANIGNAIYSEGDIKVTAEKGYTSLFKDNETAFNMAKEDTKLTLNVEDGGIITVNDNITGAENGYDLDITSDKGSEVNLYGTIENARIAQNGNVSLIMDWKNITDRNNSLALNDGNLTWENVDGPLKLNLFEINGGMLTISQLGSKASIEAPIINLKSGFLEIGNADVDLATEQMGHLKADKLDMGEVDLLIDIRQFTLLSDAEKEKTSIVFLDADQKSGELLTDYNKNELMVSYVAEEAVAPVYKYTVNYDEAAGAFEFERFKVQTEEPDPVEPDPVDPVEPDPVDPVEPDPVDPVDPVEPVDPNPDKPNHGVVDEEYKIYNEGAFANDVFSLSSLNTQEDVINQAVDLSSLQDLDYSKGRFWATPYYNNSTMNYKNFYSVDSENYGVIAGLDSKAYDYGWIKAVYTIFGAYNNGEDKYQGIQVDNRSWIAGLKASLYNDGFYGDALVNYATHNAELETAFGKDDVDTEGYGAALRAGYIFETSKLIYDTSVMLNWQTVEGNDYTSVKGAKVSTDDYRRLSLIPQLKVGYKVTDDLTPYALVRYYAILDEEGRSVLNDIALSEIENKDSVEYGFGFETKQGEKHNIYAHILRQDGGRDGWRLSVGYKYNF